MFKKDSILFGIIIGSVLPAIIYLILYLLIQYLGNGIPYLRNSTAQLVGVAVNILTLRYYLLTLQADKTGRGILIVTFIYAFVFVGLRDNTLV